MKLTLLTTINSLLVKCADLPIDSALLSKYKCDACTEFGFRAPDRSTNLAQSVKTQSRRYTCLEKCT